MEITVRKGYLSEFDLEMTKCAIHYYLQQLLLDQFQSLSESVEIQLQILKKALPNNVEATVDHDVVLDFQTIYDYSQNLFKLKILKNKETSLKNYLTVLAHECVHIKQALLKELRFFVELDSVRVILWRDRVMGDLSDVSHKNLPWEREAFSKQDVLAEKFIISYAEILKKRS